MSVSRVDASTVVLAMSWQIKDMCEPEGLGPHTAHATRPIESYNMGFYGPG